MVQAMSLFNQLLRHFPSLEFAALVKKHRAERAAKGLALLRIFDGVIERGLREPERTRCEKYSRRLITLVQQITAAMRFADDVVG